MARRHHYKRRTKDAAHEIDVTTFLNLMVVLVPFLLITAVFSRLTIVELNLPSSAGGPAADKDGFPLEVIVREDRYRDHATARPSSLRYRTRTTSTILQTLSDYMVELKQNYPEQDAASVLMEARIPYDYLIQVMDIVRSVEVPIEARGGRRAASRTDGAVLGHLGRRRTVRNSRRIKRMSRNRVKIAKMNLTSLMDVFTILVFFLLVNSGSVELLESPKNVTLPESREESKPRETVVISISPEDVLVQGKLVARVADILEGNDDPMGPLTARLADLKESVIGPNTLAVAESQEVTILADKSVPFVVVRKVMSVCTGEGYENVSLAVIQIPSQVAAR